MQFSPKEAFSNFSPWRGLALLYPQLCVSCQRTLPAFATCFCFTCRSKLDPTLHHLEEDNEFTQRFWGRLSLCGGAAMYFFHKKSPIQRALHALKYRNKPETGVKIGREFGRILLKNPAFAEADGIVPVPLHPHKERERGYNQSAVFAKGLSDALGIPVWDGILKRQAFTKTQTTKGRLERFENVGTVFALQHAKTIADKHLLLVDDVLTTGATLEACGELLLSLPNTRLSMATIAIAMQH